jgi:ATP-binding cassette subfamily C (CFTR/MRP) protein 1
MLWSVPLKLIITFTLLWWYMNVASLTSLITVILLIILSILLAVKAYELQKEKLKYQDARISLVREILDGIKTIKFNCWEKKFQEFVNKIRDVELIKLFKLNVCYAIVDFSHNLASFLVSL